MPRTSRSRPPRPPRPPPACELRLLGELGGSRLAHHSDPDLAWVGQLLFDLFGDVAGEKLPAARSSTTSGSTMTRTSRPACIAKTFSTPSCPRASSSSRSSRLTYASSDSLRAPGRPPDIASAAWVSTASTVRALDLVVVCLDGVHDVLVLAAPPGDLRADDGVAAFDFMSQRLADVVQESAPLEQGHVEAGVPRPSSRQGGRTRPGASGRSGRTTSGTATGRAGRRGPGACR